jgi:hypothetical protein
LRALIPPSVAGRRVSRGHRAHGLGAQVVTERITRRGRGRDHAQQIGWARARGHRGQHAAHLREHLRVRREFLRGRLARPQQPGDALEGLGAREHPRVPAAVVEPAVEQRQFRGDERLRRPAAVRSGLPCIPGQLLDFLRVEPAAPAARFAAAVQQAAADVGVHRLGLDPERVRRLPRGQPPVRVLTHVPSPFVLTDQY